jgi:hypothetical protein
MMKNTAKISYTNFRVTLTKTSHYCLQSCSFEVLRNEMDLFPNEQNFDLDKSRQTFHHSLKEHHKISNIPKFRCEML